MESIKLIKDRQEYYRGLIKHLGCQISIAKKLEFDTEVQKIENDKSWAMEIIELLEEVCIKVQSEVNTPNQ